MDGTQPRYKPKTIDSYRQYSVMRHFNWAVKRKLIPENTAKGAQGEPMVRRELRLTVE